MGAVAMGGSIEDILDARVRVAVREEMRGVMREVLAELKPDTGDFLSVREAARIAKVDPKTIRQWMKDGKLARHWAGTRLRVRRDELARCMERPPEGGAELTADTAAEAVLAKLKGA